MRVHIVVTSDDGISYEGDADLAAVNGNRPSAGSRRTSKPAASSSSNAASRALDMNLPMRAFVTRYGKGLNGQQKYALLVARLCKGEVDKTVAAKDVDKEWKRLSGPMGGPYQTIYSTRAKEQGWIDSEKRGTVVLLRDWKNALATD